MIDKQHNNHSNQPAIVLIHPQMGENIGAVARAMLNCGLTDLRLVNPRDGWPNESAIATSAGALEIIPPVRLFETTEASIADCHYIYATTIRTRDMNKPAFTARTAAQNMYDHHQKHKKTAILFGPERSGLTNDDVALSHAAIHIPLNPDFSSLNLAQAVLLTAYEYSQLSFFSDQSQERSHTLDDIAPHGEQNELFERLKGELEKHHFFRNPGHKPIMTRNIRNILLRAEMSSQETRTFHGVISALTGKKVPPES